MAVGKLVSLFTTICLLVGSASPVIASDDRPITLPPMNLQADYDEQTGNVSLTWSPPDDGEYTYNVYRDGELLDVAMTAQYQDRLVPDAVTQTVKAVYKVTASPLGSSVEGLPSPPAIVSSMMICEPVIVFFDPWATDPLVVAVDESCIEMWERTFIWWYSEVLDMLGVDDPRDYVHLPDPEDHVDYIFPPM